MNEKTNVTSARSRRKAAVKKSTPDWDLGEKMAKQDQEGVNLLCPDQSFQETIK